MVDRAGKLTGGIWRKWNYSSSGGHAVVVNESEGKARIWQERFERHAKSGETVAAFCAREGVSSQSFYWWKKKLGVAGTGARKRRDRVPSPTFRAVRVTPSSGPLRIQFPHGAQIEVPSTDLALVRTVLKELLCAGYQGTEDEESC